MTRPVFLITHSLFLMDYIYLALGSEKNFFSINFFVALFKAIIWSSRRKECPKEQCKLFLMYSVVYRHKNPYGFEGGDPVLKGTSFFVLY